MCRRFYFLGDNAAVQRSFPQLLVPHPLAPRYDIAPQQPVAVISNTNRNYLDHFLWGLVPSWAKEPSIGNRMINVPAELLTEKPTFRTAFRRRRCLLPADGFYGQRAGIPVVFHLNPPRLFALSVSGDTWNGYCLRMVGYDYIVLERQQAGQYEVLAHVPYQLSSTA
ncbi:MAG TPA: SOS response-associated peptidase family protein, partial [Armatimonadota bacterium]|nr:SOS response-associated peptidase family protein [Armatimonadota bacterium]